MSTPGKFRHTMTSPSHDWQKGAAPTHQPQRPVSRTPTDHEQQNKSNKNTHSTRSRVSTTSARKSPSLSHQNIKITGLRPGTSNEHTLDEENRQYEYTQAPMDDDSINSTESGGSVTQKKQSKFKEDFILEPPNEDDFSLFHLWIIKNFSAYIDCSDEVLEHIIVNVFRIRSIHILRHLTNVMYKPDSVARILREQGYNLWKSHFAELHMIFRFVLMSFDCELVRPWAFDEYLLLREHNHESSHLRYSSKPKSSPAPASVPPSYTAKSPHFDKSQSQHSSGSNSSRRRPKRGMSQHHHHHSSHSYKSSSPNRVWNTPEYTFQDKMDVDKPPSTHSHSVKPYQYDPRHVPDSWNNMPKDEGSNRSRSARSSSQRTSRSQHYRYTAMAKPRSKLSDKITWDGHHATFKAYSKVVDGHLLQVNAGYLTNPHFVQKYSEMGMSYIISDEFWNTYQVSIPQVKADATYLYGMLFASNRGRDDKILMRHSTDQDGIAAWIAFKEDYGNNGSKELKVNELEVAIKKMYDPTKEGVAGYIDRFSAQMQELESLIPGQYGEAMKKRLILSNMSTSSELTYFVQTCRDNPSMSFKDVTTYFRRNAAWMDQHQHSRQKLSSHRSGSNTMLRVGMEEDEDLVTDHVTEVSQETNLNLNLEETTALIHKLSSETSVYNTYQSLQSKTFRESLRIPDSIWNMLEPSLRKKIDEIRSTIRKQRADKAKKESQPQSLPVQYPSKSKESKESVDVVVNLCNQLGSVAMEEEYDTDDDDIHLYKFTTITCDESESSGKVEVADDIPVRAHFEYATVFDNPKRVYAIADGGADSCVLGANAHVIHETGRYATLLGYDPAKTRSGRVPIVTAYLKAKAQNGIPVFLKINEAPFNAGCTVTLLSEYQIREYGHVIDSVATKHKTPSGTYGSQRLVLNDAVHIPFKDRGAIHHGRALRFFPLTRMTSLMENQDLMCLR